MNVKIGSIWIDNDSDLLVIVKSLEGNFDGKVKVVFNYIVRTGSGCFEATSSLDLFLSTKTKLVRNDESDYSKGYEHGVQHMKMQGCIDKYQEESDKVSLTEGEFESIIDEAFEEGYEQAHSELHAPTSERERVLQEKAWDDGYDQAVCDLIDGGLVEGVDGEYSEYKFGVVEDKDGASLQNEQEEEYCFIKELEGILNGGVRTKYCVKPTKDAKKSGAHLDDYHRGYEDGKSRGITLGYNKRDYEKKNKCVVDVTVKEGSERKHSHYFKDVRHLDYVDIYQVCKLFEVEDSSHCTQHSIKKLLMSGKRGAKDKIKDITEARDTLSRYLQIEGYE